MLEVECKAESKSKQTEGERGRVSDPAQSSQQGFVFFCMNTLSFGVYSFDFLFYFFGFAVPPKPRGDPSVGGYMLLVHRRGK